MTNQEVVDRLADAVRHVELFVDPNDMVHIFCEDNQNDQPGKKYIFTIQMPLVHFKNLFEARQPDAKGM